MAFLVSGVVSAFVRQSCDNCAALGASYRYHRGSLRTFGKQRAHESGCFLVVIRDRVSMQVQKGGETRTGRLRMQEQAAIQGHHTSEVSREDERTAEAVPRIDGSTATEREAVASRSDAELRPPSAATPFRRGLRGRRDLPALQEEEIVVRRKKVDRASDGRFSHPRVLVGRAASRRPPRPLAWRRCRTPSKKSRQTSEARRCYEIAAKFFGAIS